MIAIRTFADWQVELLAAVEIQRREEFAKKLADLKKLVGKLEEVIRAARVASAEEELSAPIRSMPVADADCPF